MNISRVLKALLMIAGVAFAGPAVRAAEFNVFPASADFPAIISVKGEIYDGDDSRLQAALAGISSGVVVLEGPGGSLVPGIRMGNIIRLRGLSTIVLAETSCASACALAWLGGVDRYLGVGARIGFHAAYQSAGGILEETGSGNARVGHYLTNLGLSEEAITYMTSAPPQDLWWLTPMAAARYGIEVIYLPPRETAPAATQAPVANVNPSADDLQRRAVELTLQNLQLAGVLSPEAYGRFVSENYAETVDHFGTVTPKAKIVADAQAYKRRWPALVYTVSTRPTADCRGSSCLVEGVGTFDGRSAERNARSWGTFRFSYRLVEDGGRLLIVGDGGEVLSREAGPIENGESLAQRLQVALERRGCRPGPIDGIWGRSSQGAMVRFNRANRSSLSTEHPTSHGLEVVEASGARRCAAAGTRETAQTFEMPW